MNTLTAVIFALSVAASPARAASSLKSASASPKGTLVASKETNYQTLLGKTREEIIEFARAEVLKSLKGVDFKFYRDVSVVKTSKYLRVRFESHMTVPAQEMSSRDLNLPGPLSGAQRTSMITFFSSAQREQVEPYDISQVFKLTDEMLEIAKTFGPKDSLNFEETPEMWFVGVSHPRGENGRGGGGWEKYSINKKTKERKMVDHEHPPSRGRDDENGIVTLDGRPPKPDPDPEVELASGERVSGTSTPLPPTKAAEDVRAVATKIPITYAQLVKKSRAEIIAVAREEIAKALKGVRLDDYAYIRVYKTSKYLRVRMDSNMRIADKELAELSLGHSARAKTSELSFVASEFGAEVNPKDVSRLYEITDDMREVRKRFDISNSLSFTDRGDKLEVRRSHPTTADSSGGWEKYLIDKKTHESQMLQHAHPRSRSREDAHIEGLMPTDPDPEIEILEK